MEPLKRSAVIAAVRNQYLLDWDGLDSRFGRIAAGSEDEEIVRQLSRHFRT